MEKAACFVVQKNNEGEVRLPPGFRFHPTDVELVLHYLRRKVMCHPLPASIVLDFDVCKADPWDLPGDKLKERYFFSTREAKYPNGNRSNRATVSGYWKATGKEKPIIVAGVGNGGGRNYSYKQQQQQHAVVVGMKKTLVFYRGKPPSGSRTDWIMHEYRLVTSNFSSGKKNVSNNSNHIQKQQQSPSDDWVLCRIFLKKRKSNNTTTTSSNEYNNHHHMEEEVEEAEVEDYFKEEEQEDVCTNNDSSSPAITVEDDKAAVMMMTTISSEGMKKPVYYYDFMSRDKKLTTDLNLAPPDINIISRSSSGSSGVTIEASTEFINGWSSEDRDESSSSNSNSSSPCKTKQQP